MTKKKLDKEDLKILSGPFTDGYQHLSDLAYVLYLQGNITKDTFNYTMQELNKMSDVFDDITNRIRYE